MQTITVKDRQTFLDLAMQHSGSAEAAFNMALQNNMALTADLIAGTILPTPAVVFADIVQLFKVEKAVPASILLNSIYGAKEGIDYWAIENDFIVQ
jgi:hypothetical protein